MLPSPASTLASILALLAACLTVPVAARSTPQDAPAPPQPQQHRTAADPEHPHLGPLRLDQIQVIGTHNSYKQAIQPELFEVMLAHDPGSQSLDYAHLPLDRQLDLGVRNLELDVYNDPHGGHYRTPLGILLLRGLGVQPLPFDAQGQMDQPGFKVMHDCNFDYRSHHLTLKDALATLRRWSDAHRGHLPIVVTMNLKGGSAPVPGAIDPVDWDTQAMRRLDGLLLEALGQHKLITPDLVRRDAPTLRQAVERLGWPTIDQLRGRFLFVLDHGGALRDMYVDGNTAMLGRPMFTSGPLDAPFGVVHVINEPIEKQDQIRRLVQAGHLVRTRADAGTREIRTNDRRRFDAAMRSGAQVITTDYPIPDSRHNPDYRVVFEDGTYARPNPVTAPKP